MRIATSIAAATIAAALLGGSPAMSDETNDAANEAANATNRFTVDLYRAVAAKPGNVFASPMNVATALGMTALGAKGETADQIAAVLHLPAEGSAGSLGKLAAAIRESIRPAEGNDAGLSAANAGWFETSESILPEYVGQLRDSFGAEPRRVDFRNSPDAARETINHWVADETRGKIRDLLKPEHVGPDSVLVLTSAIHFKGYWALPFDEKLTKDGPFHAADGDVPSRLMWQSAQRLPYREDDEAQVVALPYKDGTLSMIVALPRKPDGLAAVEAGLTAEKIGEWATTMRPAPVNVTLPRFRSEAEIDLKDVLAGLGMTDAFDPSKADFSGINGRRDLFVSAVIHKAFVEVEEKGTEAAAATGVVASRTSAMIRPPVEFRADRPFLYLIRDAKTGAIAFIGRMARP